MKKEQSIASNSVEKLFEDEGYPFKMVNEDVHKSNGYVEEGWYEPRGTDSLWDHYSEEDVQYILWRRMEKRQAMAEKEVINLTGDSDWVTRNAMKMGPDLDSGGSKTLV